MKASEKELRECRMVFGFHVSPDGRIYSADGSIFTPYTINGRLYVPINKGEKSFWLRAEKLVALAFVFRPAGLTKVKFVDGDPTNIRATNLTWVDNFPSGARGRRVIQTDCGNIIASWPNARIAGRALNICASSISRCCHKKAHHLTAGGYGWAFEDDLYVSDDGYNVSIGYEKGKKPLLPC